MQFSYHEKDSYLVPISYFNLIVVVIIIVFYCYDNKWLVNGENNFTKSEVIYS